MILSKRCSYGVFITLYDFLGDAFYRYYCLLSFFVLTADILRTVY